MFIGLAQIAMYHYDMYVKVAYDNFDNKRRYDDDDDVYQCISRCHTALSYMHWLLTLA